MSGRIFGVVPNAPHYQYTHGTPPWSSVAALFLPCTDMSLQCSALGRFALATTACVARPGVRRSRLDYSRCRGTMAGMPSVVHAVRYSDEMAGTARGRPWPWKEVASDPAGVLDIDEPDGIW